MKIPTNMILNSVSHDRAGNFWAVAQWLPEEWAVIVSCGNGILGSQFFSAWTKLLTPEDNKLTPELLNQLNTIRRDLESGKCVIRNTRLVEV